jgi:hypothetical protein
MFFSLFVFNPVFTGFFIAYRKVMQEQVGDDMSGFMQANLLEWRPIFVIASRCAVGVQA